MPDNFFNLNNPDFFGILIRFVINIAFIFVLIRVIYFRYSKKEKFLFTFFMMGITVFFVSSMLKSVFIEFGMAVGLFAIFAILRFRTRNFGLKDMSYIFTTIAISLINSLKLVGFPVLGVVIFNIIILISAIFLEEFALKNNTTTFSIIYEDLELLQSAKKPKMLKELSDLTGKEILKYRVRKIDYKKKVASIDVSYKD
jgi:cellulose synthase/poly-beta-1,6-N-acetylglucosamine synthase-like glycosyltransferase